MDTELLEEQETLEVDPSTEQELEADREQEIKRLKRRIFWKRFGFGVADLGLLVAQITTGLMVVFAAVPFILSFFLGFSFNTILSGSMSGAIETGDLVITQQYHGEQLTVGQIVGVETNQGRVTHRITEVNDDGTYTTKGDANPKPDLFKPRADDIWGLPVTIFHQPMASLVTAFALDATWASNMWTAITSGNWGSVGALLPGAPWGVLALLACWLVFFWFIPDYIAHLQAKAQQREELAMALLKKQVEDHEESLEEIEPVVEEFKEEKAKKEADEAAFKDAQAKAWDEFDPTAPIYDEPEVEDFNPFTEAFEAEALPEPVLEADDIDSLLVQLQARHGTTGLTARSRQSEFPSLDASTPATRTSKHTAQASAFYLEEED